MEEQENQDKCIFCKIINGKISSKKIYEDDEIFAFHDIHPVGPVHFMLIPKRHIHNITEAGAEDSSLLGKLIFKAQELAVELGCKENGFRIINNCKTHGGQTVDHLHFHVIGGRQLGWPPG